MESNPTRWQLLSARILRQAANLPRHGRTFGRFCSVIVASAALLFPAVAPAQSSEAGTITGQVSNSATGQYLTNAEVTLVGTDQVAITGQGGRYVFVGVPAGPVTVSSVYPGLDKMEQSVTVVGGQVAKADFALKSGQYDSVLKLDTFVVSSQREGNAKAIVDQRQASNIKTVIAADAFGTVSEDNVGEFLKYMSGLSLDYVENDARQVRVRGLSAKYANVTVDGNPVASADFGIATGRSFQFEQVSLSTIDTIEMNKTPMADLPANSLAGTINVKSKSALNQVGRRMRYNANLTLNEFAMTLGKTVGWDNKERRKALPGGSFEFSDTFMDGRLGVVAAVNHTGTYVEQKIIANLARTFDSDATNNATEIPRITQVNWQDGLKPTFRDSVLINVDFKATPELIVSLRTSYNAYDAPFHNRNWTINANTNDTGTTTYSSMTASATSATDTGKTATVAGTNFRKYGATFNINPAVNWKISPNIEFDGQLSYSRSYQWYDSDAEGFFNIVSARMTGTSWGYTSSLGEPDLQMTQRAGAFNDTRSWFNLANYNNSTTVQTAHRDAKDQTFTARADMIVRFPDLRMPTVLKFGVDSRLLVKDIGNWTKVWDMNVNPAAGGLDLRNFADPYTPSPHKSETIRDVTGAIGAPPSLDKWKLYSEFLKYNTDPMVVTTTAQQPFTLSTARVAANLRNRLQNMWDLEETINSAYVMATVRADKKLTAVAGLRFESTETEGRAYDDLGHRGTLLAMGLPTTIATNSATTNQHDYISTRYGTRLKKSQSYDDLFPSFQVRYAASDSLVFRGAYYSSILRPDVQNVARSLVINDTQTTYTTANPDLKPEYADNYDARVEYYFEPVGVISAGVFYKSIKDIQISQTVDFTLDNVPQDIIDLGEDPADLVARSAQFSRSTNGPDTSMWGFELDYSQQLSFLPGPLGGLSVFANYTRSYMDEEKYFTGGSGVTTQTWNAGVNYRAKGFNGQIKFNWVDDRLLSTTGYSLNSAGEYVLSTGANAGALQYEAKRFQIDVNTEYALSPKATIFLNIANLTGAPSVRYQVHEANLIRHGAFGAKYTIGVKGSF